MTRRSATLLAMIGFAACDSTRTSQPTAPSVRPEPGAASANATPTTTLYTSNTSVMAYAPIAEPYAGTDWGAKFCTASPAVSRTDPRWMNGTQPHHAFTMYHPWQNDYFVAPWINAWDVNQFQYPNWVATSAGGNPTSPNYNWTKYSTEVEGNGSFVIQLLADNCSWIYLDGTLVGVQGSNLSQNSYGLTLNGKSTLEFIIFDGGGLAGGKFKLETTSNPPPPLDSDNDGLPNTADNCPFNANADQKDLDLDGIGDVCDPDIDGDGVPNGNDAFPNDPTRSSADNTPPVVTHSITGATPSAAGWYGSDVTVTFTTSDPEGNMTTTGCDVQHVTTTTTADGATFTCTATSAGGTTNDVVTIKLDKTKPTVTGAVTSGTPGANGWYTSDVGITWTASPAGPSGQTLSPDCAATTLAADSPSTVFTCTVTTGAGVSSAQGSLTVKRDASKPVITPTVSGPIGSDGWYVGDVTVSWSTVDATSGVASSTGCSTVITTTDNTGTNYTCAVTNGAGLTSSKTVSAKRDATKPVVSYTGNAGAYTVDQRVAITCAASDAMSGIATKTCADVGGDAFTFALGANSFSASATDNAGNTGGASATFTVSVTSGSLCALVQRWVSNAGVQNSMCVKLQKGNYAPFRNELSAQSGKMISVEHANTLMQLVNALDPR